MSKANQKYSVTKHVLIIFTFKKNVDILHQTSDHYCFRKNNYLFTKFTCKEFVIVQIFHTKYKYSNVSL